MRKQQAIEQLERDGWEHFKRYDYGENCTAFYKRFDTSTTCNHNDGKKGKQVELYLWDFKQLEAPTIDIEIVGEIKDGSWIKIQQWSFNSVDKALSVITRMIATWEFAANWEASK